MSSLPGIGPLMLQRLVANWRLLLVLSFGILVAATLMAISPIYTRVMNDLGLEETLEERLIGASRNGYILTNEPLGDSDVIGLERELAQAMSEEIGWFIGDEARFGRLPDLPVVRAGELVSTPSNRNLLQYAGISNLEDHVRIVEGRMASASDDPTNIEVMLPLETARKMGATIGDPIDTSFTYDDCNRPAATDDPVQAAENRRFACTPTTFVSVELNTTLVGIFQPIDEEEPFWSGSLVFFGEPSIDPIGPTKITRYPVVMTEETFFGALPKIMPGFPHDFRYYGLIEPTKLNSANLDEALNSLEQLRDRIQLQAGIADLATVNALANFENRSSFNQVTLVLLLIQVVGIAVYFVILVSTLLSERRSEEVAMLRSRGATVGQLMAMSATEAFALGLLAAVVAPFVAGAAVAALGQTGTFEPISGGGFLPFRIVPMAFVFALGGAAIAALAVLIPSFFAARGGLVVFLRSAARPGKPLLQRYFIDVAIVLAAGFALYQLEQRDSVFDPRGVGGWSADPLLLLSPMLLILAVGAILFRFLPLVLGLVARILSTTSGPGVTLGLWQVTRSPARYNQLALLVVMAAAVGTFTATYGETTDKSQDQRALYATGADIRIESLGELSLRAPEALSQLEAVPGIDDAFLASRTETSTGPIAASGQSIGILGIDPAAATQVAWWRDDFSEQSLRATMARLQGTPLQQHGIALPGEPVSASIYVDSVGARPSTTLWLRTVDANGIFRSFEFGKLDFLGYEKLTVEIDAANRGVVYPLSVVGIVLSQARTLNDETRDLFLDNLSVTSASGEEVVIEDFEGPLKWEVMLTATRDSDRVQLSSSGAFDGQGALHFTFRAGSGASLRGATVTDASVPIPAVVSNSFVTRNGLSVGDTTLLLFGRLLLPVRVVGTVEYFPTMYDSGGGYIVVNQADLAYFAGITGELENATRATEAWLSVAPDEAVREDVRATLFDLYRIPDGVVLDSQEFLTELRSDPIVRAGGSGILLVALVAALAILALGFSLTLYLGGQARSVEVSVMRAVGISSRQLLVMIGLEYLLIAAIGLAVGTFAGLQISETMLSFLDVTNTGGRVVPEFDLSTQWDTVAIAFAALGAAFVIGVLALAGYLVRLPVSRVIRLTR